MLVSTSEYLIHFTATASYNEEEVTLLPKENSLQISGGGLSGLLLLAAHRHYLPGESVVLYEKKASLSVNHTWSFHEADITPSAWAWLRPLVSHSWQGYSVRFSTYQRSFSSQYHSIRSVDLAKKILANSANQIHLGEACPNPQGAILATGWPELIPPADRGFQKFLGLNFRTQNPHGISRPVLMDASVAQKDGYRFVYVLPWSAHELLIEDTYYANEADLDFSSLREGIESYANALGLGKREILSEESGALPLPFRAPKSNPGFAIGAAAGIFHPVTGYTVPHTVRQIEALFENKIDRRVNLASCQKEIRAEMKFFYFLNRMLFRSADPEARHRVLERFYRLPEPLIQNFYAGKLSLAQKFRLLAGRPPVPVGRALKEIFR